jgi:hypothetical protein
MRDITVRRILTHGWHLAVTMIPKGSRSDDFCIIEGWEWIYPELLGSPVEPSLGLIRDVTMLRSMSGAEGNQKRLETITGAYLNEAAAELEKPPREYHPLWCRPGFWLDAIQNSNVRPVRKWLERTYEFLPFARNWIVADHADIATPIKREIFACDGIAFELHGPTRISGLNSEHNAWLTAIAGKTVEPPPRQKRHYAGDMAAQTAATDMTFEHVGYRIDNRRERENEFLEATEKVLTKGKRKGRTYRPNKAGPCKTLISRGAMLEGWASWHALFDMYRRPPKKGSQHWRAVRGVKRGESIKHGNERGLFDDCQRETPIEVYTSDFKVEQELQDTQTFDLSAKRSRRNRTRPLREIPVSWEWGDRGKPARHSYADELMTLAAKKPVPHEWGSTLFGMRLVYGTADLDPNHENRTLMTN